jgi:ureidoglycolate hydrolase
MNRLPEPEPLDPEAFAPYGKVLRRAENGDAFQDLHTESDSRGWRVALLDPPAGPMRRVHRHPDSEECFATVSGDPCIAVAPEDDPEAFRLFRLEEPVCVRRKIWHEIVTREPARVFIAENAEISGEEFFLDPMEW